VTIIEFAHNATIAAFVILGVNVALNVYGTIAKNEWGINLRRVRCPRCAAAQRWLRWPTSGRQAMWGGHTCAHCGCEMDKWGRPLRTEAA
jgi:hypothetical protein